MSDVNAWARVTIRVRYAEEDEITPIEDPDDLHDLAVGIESGIERLIGEGLLSFGDPSLIVEEYKTETGVEFNY